MTLLLALAAFALIFGAILHAKRRAERALQDWADEGADPNDAPHALAVRHALHPEVYGDVPFMPDAAAKRHAHGGAGSSVSFHAKGH